MNEDTDSVLAKRPISEPNIDNTVGIELLNSWPLKCAYAVQEIFKTETDYISSLSDIIQGYKFPLSCHLKSNNEGHRIISTLFGNIDDIYDLHKSLLEHLRSHRTDPHGFGQVFISSEESFKIYTHYCTNFDGAIECLQVQTKNNKDLEMFLSACQHNLSHLLPLSSQLIKPVQRIMKYHIMLKEVVKNFNHNHHGYRSLDSAHKAMVRIGNYINEVKKQKENADRILYLQNNLTGWTGKDVKSLNAYGDLIIEDTGKVGARGIERQVILFDKLLLILKKKEDMRYTYKGHILASELYVDQKFSESNPTMFKVSSLLHRQHTYIVDVGTSKKQQVWLNKMYALIRKIIDQAKKGRIMSSIKSPSTQHQVKRRKMEEIEEVDTEKDNEVVQNKDRGTSLKFIPGHKVGRVLTSKRKTHTDVRDLFPEQNNASKLMSYSVPSSQVKDTLPMPTIPKNRAYHDAIPNTTPQYREQIKETEPNQKSKSSSNSSSSMDSVLSLSDVDFGIREENSVGGDTVGGDTGEKRMSKLSRKPAIRVKRSKTIPSVSHSPPSIQEESITGNQDTVIKFVEDSDQSVQSVPSITSSGISTDDVDLCLYENGSSKLDGEVLSGQNSDQFEFERPSGALMLKNENGVVAKRIHEFEDSFKRISPAKRPRSSLHDQDRPDSDQSIPFAVVLDSEDNLELGESCGQSKLRGRDSMPIEDSTVNSIDEAENIETSGGGTGLYLGGDEKGIEATGRGEGDFVIEEDSSDSEEEEEEEEEMEDDKDADVIEDLELAAQELESSLLEAAKMGESASLWEDNQIQQDQSTDQIVPMEGDTVLHKPWVPLSEDVSEFFTSLNDNTDQTDQPDGPVTTQPPSQGSSALSPSLFQFSASPKRSKHTADVYGTLPHKKKASSPGQDPTFSPRSTNSPRRSFTRRGEGFSRLLEFTRQQAVIEPSDIEVTQSLPVCLHHKHSLKLDDIEENSVLMTSSQDQVIMTNDSSSIGIEEGSAHNRELVINNGESEIVNEESEILNGESKIVNEKFEVLNGESEIVNEELEILNEESKIGNEELEILNEESKNGNEDVPMIAVEQILSTGLNTSKDNILTVNEDLAILNSVDADGELFENEQPAEDLAILNSVDADGELFENEQPAEDPTILNSVDADGELLENEQPAEDEDSSPVLETEKVPYPRVSADTSLDERPPVKPPIIDQAKRISPVTVVTTTASSPDDSSMFGVFGHWINHHVRTVLPSRNVTVAISIAVFASLLFYAMC